MPEDLPAAGAIDLGLHAWERPGQREAMAERILGLHREGARVVLAAEGRGSLERAGEVLAAKAIPTEALLAVEADIEEGFWFRPEPDSRTALALVTEEDLWPICEYLCTIPHTHILTPRRERQRHFVDQRLFQAGLVGSV